ncbi:SEL1-like repeat protein [Alphaproteobacteria bacterium]|nr:SEL1-like repeat protein [Alphaproteobacteria bacterium]
MKKSAFGGNVSSAVELGKIFQENDVVPRKPELSFEFYMIAEKLGDEQNIKEIINLGTELFGETSGEVCKRYDLNKPNNFVKIAKCIEAGFLDGAAGKYWIAGFDNGDTSSLIGALKHMLILEKDEYNPNIILSRLKSFYENASIDLSKNMDDELISLMPNMQEELDKLNIGMLLADNERPSSAWLVFLDNIADTSPDASLFLADNYLNGTILDKNEELALRYYKFADQLGTKNLKSKILNLTQKYEGKLSEASCKLYGKNDKSRATTLAQCATKGFISGSPNKYWVWAFENGNKDALIKIFSDISKNSPSKLDSYVLQYMVGASRNETEKLLEEIKKNKFDIIKNPTQTINLGKIVIQETKKLDDGKFLFDWAVDVGSSKSATFLMESYSNGKFTKKDIDKAIVYGRIAENLGANVSDKIVQLTVSKSGENVAAETCSRYNKETTNPEIIAGCIEAGFLEGISAHYWLKAYETNKNINSLVKAIENLKFGNDDPSLNFDIASALINFDDMTSESEQLTVINTVKSLNLNEDVCEEKKDSMGFSEQGDIGQCLILAYSGNKPSLEKIIEKLRSGNSILGTNKEYADYLFNKWFIENDVVKSECDFILKQLENKPKEHLSKAKQCLEENAFINSGVVGLALQFELKGLIYERNLWPKYFDNVGEAKWVLEHIDWNELSDVLISDAILFLNSADIQEFSEDSVKLNLRKLEFREDWMADLTKKSPSLAQSELRKFVNDLNCDAVNFGLKNPRMITSFPKEFSDAQKSDNCALANLTTSETISLSNDEKNLPQINNQNEEEFISLALKMDDIEDQDLLCSYFGKYLRNKEEFINQVPKELMPPIVKQEKQGLEDCSRNNGFVAYELGRDKFLTKNYEDALDLFKFSCENNIYEACGWSAGTMFFYNHLIPKQSSNMRELKTTATNLARKGYLGQDSFSGTILYDLLNASLVSTCLGTSCEKEVILNDLLEKNVSGGIVRYAEKCIRGSNNIIEGALDSLNGRKNCASSCIKVEELLIDSALDPFSKRKAQEIVKSKRC